MSFVIGLLMFVMVLVSIALIFLVLIQLPKKDAGVGVAFGGGATDALFGAGSGNVLTKMTKYLAIAFFMLALLVGAMQSKLSSKNRGSSFGRAVEQKAQELPAAAATTTTPATTPAPGTAVPATAPSTSPAPTTPPAETPAQK